MRKLFGGTCRVADSIHRSTRSSLVRNAAEGGGALFAFVAFEELELELEFTPTPATADLQTIREALGAPHTDVWTAAMDAEIESSRRSHAHPTRILSRQIRLFAANSRTGRSSNTRRD